MVKLNLPSFHIELKKEQDRVQIFDLLRKRYVVLTPEEWVRQHFIHYLIDHLRYPKSLIKLEGGLIFNKLQKRSDIVIFDRNGQPWMIVECKAPTQKISERTIHQASVYNYTLKAKFLVVTNGLEHFCYQTDWINATTMVLQSMPEYNEAS
jgi:hypothetical protein